MEYLAAYPLYYVKYYRAPDTFVTHGGESPMNIYSATKPAKPIVAVMEHTHHTCCGGSVMK